MSGSGKGEFKVDVAYDAIRRRIVEGELSAGDRLVMDRLGVELGLSSVPVREAIRRLEAEGFVEFQRHAGPRVASVAVDAFVESMQLLAVLEAGATGLGAPFVTRGDLREARKWHRTMKAQLARLDPVGFSAANREFHQCLYRRCPNSRLLTLVETEWDRLRVIRRSTFTFVPERAAVSVAEHQLLLDAIDRGEPPAAIEALARDHRHAAARVVAERLQSRRDTHPDDTVTDGAFAAGMEEITA